MKKVLFGVIGLLLVTGVGLAADKVELKNEFDNINYSVGYQIGGDFKSQGVELNPELLVQGVRDAINKNTPLLSQNQMNTTLGDLKKIVTDQKAQEKQAAPVPGLSLYDRYGLSGQRPQSFTAGFHYAVPTKHSIAPCS